MGQWFTNFSGNTINEEPSDFTNIWSSNGVLTVEADASAQGGKVARLENSGSNARIAFTWDTPGTLTSSDNPIRIRARFMYTDLDDFTGQLTLGLHVSGSAGNETAYDIQPREASGTDVQILRYNNGSLSVLAGADTDLFSASTWFQALIEVHNSGIRAKIWEDGSSEPGSWTLSSSNTGTTSGKPGVLGGLNFIENVYDWIGVGTDGDDAPSEPLSTDYTADQTDGAGVTDTELIVHGSVRSDTDAAGVTDSYVALVYTNHVRTNIDDAGATDIAAQLQGHARTTTDTAGIDDIVARVAEFNRAFTDSAGVTDLSLAVGPPIPFHLVSGPSATVSVADGPSAIPSVQAGPRATGFAVQSGPSVHRG
jgi:hypothetical protein